MNKHVIKLVGGTFDNANGKPSNVISEIYNFLCAHADNLLHQHNIIEYKNGENIEDIKTLLTDIKENKPDIIFWFPNISNEEEKSRNIKELYPETMLITSKRNDNNKYSFQQLLQHALMLKANMTFEFSKQTDGKFNIHIFDPLGCEYYNGTDIQSAVQACLNRLNFISKITRRKTTPAPEDKNLILSYYFDRFSTEMYPSEKEVPIPEIEDFITIVKEHAEIFQKLMGTTDIKRFLGNASMKTPPQVGRCTKGMPSFKYHDYIFVSQRNIDKQFISHENFVPTYEENGKIYYCGNKKPSVDTPIQLKLYHNLPNIRYMIHSHNYIRNAPFTLTPIPCGAVEEADEILHVIDKEYTRYTNCCAVNLIGHGSVIMASEPKMLKKYTSLYYKRPLPERIKPMEL